MLTVLLAVTGAAKVTGAVEVKLVGAAKLAAALTVTMSELEVPSMVLLLAAKAPAVVKELAAITAALNCVAAFAVKRLELLLPSTVLPKTDKVLLLLTRVTFAAKEATALIVSVFVPLLPNTVLPAAVRTLEVLEIVSPPKKVAKPLLSMTRRSTEGLLPALVLPVALVLNMRQPPSLPVESCMQDALACAYCK